MVRNIDDLLVNASNDIRNCMHIIESNRMGFALVVDNDRKCIGSITDGDIRRELLRGARLETTITQICNKTFQFEYHDRINSRKLNHRIQFLPIINRTDGRIVAVRLPGMEFLEIDGRRIGEGYQPFLIAEIGNNHNGKLAAAHEMIKLAGRCGVDCVKFQYRNIEKLYRQIDNKENAHDLGTEYTLELLSKFQLPKSELFEAFDFCREVGLIPLCTPWDEYSLEDLEEYNLPGYKVASADLTNLSFLRLLANTGKPLIVSTGMSSEWEIKQSVALLESLGADFALLHCNSTYPTPYKDVNLKYLEKLRRIHGGVIGYSGHERGVEVPVASVALGASIVEKHFTLDKNWEGSDHKVSLLHPELKQMVEMIRNVSDSLGTPNRQITQGEMINRENLAKSIVAKHSIKVGDKFSPEHFEFVSPGQGLQPNRLNELIGKVAVRDIPPGGFLYGSDIVEEVLEAGSWRFSRPAGIPVRYHDFNSLTDNKQLDFVEFHLSFSDLKRDPNIYIRPNTIQRCAVHAPELFEGDHILDLASDDNEYRSKSIQLLNETIRVTKRIVSFFSKTERPYLVVNAGGFSENGFVEKEMLTVKYDRLLDALQQVDKGDVEILIQTMPPFPWHFGGQRYHNLFTKPEEIVEFCERSGLRVCLDVSHTMMSATFFDFDFYEAVEKIGPLSPHMHIVDSYGVDGEGVEMGAGDIDFRKLGTILQRVNPDAQFIPEIWQGHKNNGRGFWQALSFLSRHNF
nr:N-acetylneuraminate synthase family protein [Maritalea mediterranea]